MEILKIKDFKASALFLKNSIQAVEHYGHYDSFLPENINKISNELFSMDDVYACDAPVVNGKSTMTDRSLSDEGIVKGIKRYLRMGAEIHMYQYYGLRQGVVGMSGLTNTYWWRFAVIKK